MTELEIGADTESFLCSLWSAAVEEERGRAQILAAAMIRAGTRFLVETEGGRPTWTALMEQADAIMVAGNFFLGGKNDKSLRA